MLQKATEREESMSQMYLTVKDVSEKLGIAKSTAYAIIKECNVELKKEGYITLAGKIPKAYFTKKCYGYQASND